MKNSKKTLIILTPAFPANESETSWVTTQQLFVKTLKDHFADVQVIVLSLYYPYQSSTYEWHELRVTSFNGMQKRKLKHIFFWNSIWKKLKTIRNENNVIGIFSFWCGECALIGSYFGKRYSIRHYCWLCGQDARKKNKMVKFIRPRPDELIAMSDFLVREFHRNHRIKPQYMIPNGVVPELFTRPDSTERDIDILGVGTFEPLKQYDLFPEIIKSLKSGLPGIKACHCGIGSERERVELLIKKFGLEENFYLLGGKPHEEVLQLMQRTKVFLHTSNYEGFGVVCLEALYAGAHVVSFCKPMDQEIHGWTIVNSTAEMIKKASEILHNPNTQYHPVMPYTMERSVKAVMGLFFRET